MNRLLEEAMGKLQEAMAGLLVAAATDDMTPLGNGVALRKAGTSVGIGHDNLNIVIFGDLNRFKALNDQHGHTAGDAAIARVGALIDTVWVKGVACAAFRRSGDEFVVLTNEDGLNFMLESAGQFKSCRFIYNGKHHSVSMSFGAARADSDADFHALIERAEQACQVAKVEGDGVMVVWSKEIGAGAPRSIRTRCGACGTKIACDVPAGMCESHLQVCPVCKADLE